GLYCCQPKPNGQMMCNRWCEINSRCCGRR
nr:RecName: Full=Conotoxin Bu17 [Conus bullatus]